MEYCNIYSGKVMSIIFTVKGSWNALKFVIGNTCDAISLTEPFPFGSFTLQATLLLILLSYE